MGCVPLHLYLGGLAQSLFVSMIKMSRLGICSDATSLLLSVALQTGLATFGFHCGIEGFAARRHRGREQGEWSKLVESEVKCQM
jgi:hypothetical protein